VLPRSGAYAERLREGGGALFYEPGSESGLAAVLQRMLDEPELQPGLRARLPDPRSFTASMEDHVAAHLAVYALARAAGVPGDVRSVPQRERIWQAQEDGFGAELSRRTAEELGFR
jgi:hypothetical protein